MSPNSRPPLTSRLRASFESKRSKSEVTSPTQQNGFLLQDPDALRHAIDLAINGDAFQNAIAANLARLIKPSIKSALDTIQPVVETVYNHEMLLRKTSASVENILLRLDGKALPDVPDAPDAPDAQDDVESVIDPDMENRTGPLDADVKPKVTQTPATTVVSEHPKSAELSEPKIAELVGSVAEINASLMPIRHSLDNLKAASEQSATTTSVLQAQLDQMNADVGVILEKIGPSSGKDVNAVNQQAVAPELLASHGRKLDGISTDLAALRSHFFSTDLMLTIFENLKTLKENVEEGIASSNDNFNTLGVQVSNILSTVETHRDADSTAEILATVKSSHDSHATALDRLRSLNAESHASHATALEGIRTLHATTAGPGTDSSTMLPSQIDTIIGTLNSHTISLNDIKAKNVTTPESDEAVVVALPNTTLETLETHIHQIIGTLDTHTKILAEIEEDVSAEILTAIHECNEKLTTHTTALAEIREADVSDEILTALHSSNESHAEHAATLVGLNAAVKASNDSHAAHEAALTQMKDSNQASHASTLAEIKALQPGSSPKSEQPASANHELLEDRVDTIISTLETQSRALSDIKDGISTPKVLEAVNESHALLTSHTSMLESIKIGNMHNDIMDNISSLKTIVEESRAGVDTHRGLIKDLHLETKNSNTEITHAIKSLALGGAAGAGAGMLATHGNNTATDDILDEVKAVRTIVEKTTSSIGAMNESISSISTQININNTTVTTSISTLSDEVKAEIDATGTDISTSLATLSGDIRAINARALTVAVKEYGKDIQGISGAMSTLGGHVKAMGSQVSELLDGVSLNDKGVDQLREHAHMSDRVKSGVMKTVEKAPPVAVVYHKPSVDSRAVKEAGDNHEDDYSSQVADSVPTSNMTSPSSPDFSNEPMSSPIIQGKNGKKQKKEPRAKKNKKTPFVMDPDDDGEEAEGVDAEHKEPDEEN